MIRSQDLEVKVCVPSLHSHYFFIMKSTSTHSRADGHQGRFRILAIVKRATVNVQVLFSL